MTTGAHSLEDVLTVLDGVVEEGHGRYRFCCLQHDDQHPSAYIEEGESQPWIVACPVCKRHAELFEAVLERLNGNGHARPAGGLRTERKIKRRRKGHATAIYQYRLAGRLIGEKIRYPILGEPGEKTFSWRVPVVRDELWDWREPEERVLYRLDERTAADPQETVWILEGEQAVDRCHEAGLVAVCNMNGSGEEDLVPYVEQFRGHQRVVIVKDNDDPGEKHGEKWARALRGIVPEVRVLRFHDLPPKSGADDWLAIGGNTVEKLEQLAARAPLWTPLDGKTPRVHHRTDLGNALRLADRHGEDFRHVPGWGLVAWTGNRWERDVTRAMMRYASETVRAIYSEAKGEPIAGRRKKLSSWAMKSEARPRLEAMVELAKSDARVQAKAKDFDLDPMLVNVLNGTINLRIGELRPHRRHDLITKLIPIKFDPDAKCERWLSFLDEITAREEGHGKELVAFLQRAAGYSLTGYVKERVLIIAWGSGKNGKSVFLRTLAEAMGEYATVAEPQLLLARRHDSGPRSGTAQLCGARLVVAIETGEEKHLNTAFVKWITGADRLRGSFLYEDSFEFDPAFTPWLATNHKPVITETTNAIWDRIRLVPFVANFEGREDKDLAEKLRGELPGILVWAVRGCLEWQRDGLAAPPDVTTATKAYREESDELAPFLEGLCVVGPDQKVTAKAFRASYLEWCEAEGEKPLSAKAVGSRLTDLGCIAGKGTPRVWRGVGLLPRGESGGPHGDAYEGDLL